MSDALAVPCFGIAARGLVLKPRDPGGFQEGPGGEGTFGC